jgi:hypothetical protein
MALKRELREVNIKLDKWKHKLTTNWLGRLIRSIMINRLKNLQSDILDEIEISKAKYENRYK